MKQHVNKINEEHEQVIYDTLFMSETEFGLVYGELYQSYRLKELKELFHRVRENLIHNGGKYPRHLKKTRLSTLGFGALREEQGAIRVSVEEESEVKSSLESEKAEEVVKPKGSLKEEILKLHIEEKLTKSQIRDRVDCKYQYVFQTVKKYEEAQKAKKLDI